MKKVLALLGLLPTLAMASVGTTTSVVEYTCNGSTKVFSVPYKWLDQTHLRVSRVLIASPYTETLLTLTTDYIVKGTGVATGGSVTLVDPATDCPTDYKLSIRRQTPRLQTTSFSTQGSFDPKAHEAALDRGVMIAQELNDSVMTTQHYDFTGPDASAGLVTAAGGTTPRPLSSRFADVTNVLDYGATADGVTDDAAAVQAAINVVVAAGGGTVFFPPGDYKIGSSLTISGAVGRVAMKGSGMASKLLNYVTGNPSEPLIKVTAQGNNFEISELFLYGNSTEGAGGNGHAIALINPAASPYYPAQVFINRVKIHHHMGNGKDENGSSVPAAAIFAYNGTGHVTYGVETYHNATGVRYHLMQKAQFIGATFDQNKYNAMVMIESEQIGVTNSVLNGSGSGAATDGLLYANLSKSLTFTGCRFKNGSPYNVNLVGDGTVINWNITISGSDFCQLSNPGEPGYGGGGLVQIAAAPSNGPLLIEGNRWQFGNGFTGWIGVLITGAGAGGYEMPGLAIRNNELHPALYSNVAAAIRINPSTAYVRSCVIESNLIGGRTANSGTTVDYGVDMAQRATGCVIRDNVFQASTGMTITNAIAIRSTTVMGTLLQHNTYRSYSGTIVNKVATSGGGEWATLMDDVTTNDFTFGSQSTIARFTGQSLWMESSLGASIQAKGTNIGMSYRGNKAAADTGADHTFLPGVTRSAGDLIMARDYAGTQLFRLDSVGRAFFANGKTKIETDGMIWMGIGNTTTRPTCTSALRGRMYWFEGGTGVADSFGICTKNAGGNYIWLDL